MRELIFFLLEKFPFYGRHIYSSSYACIQNLLFLFFFHGQPPPYLWNFFSTPKASPPQEQLSIFSCPRASGIKKVGDDGWLGQRLMGGFLLDLSMAWLPFLLFVPSVCLVRDLGTLKGYYIRPFYRKQGLKTKFMQMKI